MPARVLLLSPHPDDIAWSLGCTVSRMRAAGAASLCVVTFFGRTRYAPGHSAHGSAEDASRVRTREEADWAVHAEVSLHRAQLPDSSLRGYDDDTEMGAPPEPEVVRETVRILRDTVRRVRPSFVLAPLAAGGHVDHAAVRQAAREPLPGTDVVWYEDLPYAAEGVPAPGGCPLVVPADGYWAAKEAGVRHFPSQQPDEVLPVLRRHAEAVSGERLWAPDACTADRLRALLLC
ncbi:PIG-L family deacetylase [Streptomyces sp. MUM 203J]|uniref:PIG-L deacetylase family protein n=1 Tax=Streptomyces sp. MUM 203J TaxID=2791990 RepID=UPI001F043D8D|nr:PIG-L family deacetylase [Streptomyces sp. MUM 203J]MCH0541487.1 PIG-L family deacetylase [Streptomyces sp. MUM 203J]